MKEIMHFEEQQQGEKIVMVIRKHFTVYLKLLFIFFLIFGFPVLLIFFILNTYFKEVISFQVVLITVVFCSIYVAYGFIFLLLAWINEAFDLFILTDERLVDITQVNFFKRSVATTPLNQIQDSTSHVNGFLETLLGYGDVEVQTAAGNASAFFIDQVPKPDQVAYTILNEAKKCT